MIKSQGAWVAGFLWLLDMKTMAGRGGSPTRTVAGRFIPDPVKLGWLDNRYLQSA